MIRALPAVALAAALMLPTPADAAAGSSFRVRTYSPYAITVYCGPNATARHVVKQRESSARYCAGGNRMVVALGPDVSISCRRPSDGRTWWFGNTGRVGVYPPFAGTPRRADGAWRCIAYRTTGV